MDNLLDRFTLSPRARRWLTRLARAYLGHIPVVAGKEAFWGPVVDPHLAPPSCPFVASTACGARIAGDAEALGA